VHVEGADNGCTLLVDAHPWPQVAWGIAAPIDPGEHTVELQRGAKQLRSAHVTIAPGARVEETLSLLRAPTPAAVAAHASHDASGSAPEGALSASDDDGGDSVFRSPWFWGGVGAVVIAGAATAIVIAASGGSDPATAVKGDFMPAVIEGRVP
jgi:hypothetical protein